MKKDISKSPEVIQKEALIKELQTELKKRQSVLKSLKTRLANTKQEVSDIQRKATVQMYSKMEEADRLRQEIADLSKELQKVKGLSKAEKYELEQMAMAFEEEDLLDDESYQAYQSFQEERKKGNFDFEDNHRAKMRDIYAEFQVKPEEEEQRNIRKIYIKLSQKFHPDKAKDSKEADEFHEVMQQINEAYQSGDIQVLLELEQLFLTEQLDLTDVKSYSIDVLQQAIDRLRRDLEFINNQITRHSTEIKNLRASDLGIMLTSAKKAAKHGMGLDAVLEDMQERIEYLRIIRDGLADSIKRKGISPIITEFVQKMAAEQQTIEEQNASMLEALFEQMGVSEEERAYAMDMFGFEDEEEEYEPIKNPKFKIGSSVKVKNNAAHPVFSTFNLKGLEGRVVQAYYDIDYIGNRKKVYEVELDSISLQSLSIPLIKTLLEYGEEVFNIMLFYENQLGKSKPRDTETDVRRAYRLAFHEHYWSYLPKKTHQQLKTILLQEPDLEDWENWKIYLEKELQLPFEAEVRGYLETYPGETLTVTGLAGYNKKYGIIVDVQQGDQIGTYPLLDLKPKTRKSPNFKILTLYDEWQDDVYQSDFFS